MRRFISALTKRKWTAGAAAVAVVALGYTVAPRRQNQAVTEASYVPAKRGEFVVSIVEGGSVQAVNEVLVRCELEGTARIIWIIPEGSYVQKGDLLVELDSSDLRDKITQQEIAYQTGLETFHAAEGNVIVNTSLAEGAIKDSELKSKFAKTDLDKYEEGDWPAKKADNEAAITIAEEELRRAQDRMNWTVELEKKGYATKTELEADALTVKQKQITVNQARENLRLLVKYEYPKQVQQLKANVETANREVDRVRQRSGAQTAQANAELNARREMLELQKDKLETLKKQLELTKIYAPQNGLVVYAESNPASGYMIEAGGQVRQRQELIKLPDVSKMLVKVRIHESQINQVTRDMDAFVTIDSIPDRRFHAKVADIALLPDIQVRSGNPNLKVYPTDVVIEDELPANLKPGVSARAEIMIAQKPDTITVPIQAVTTQKGGQVCFVRSEEGPKAVPVEVGLYNDRYIEIRSGVEEGTEVMLAPPTGTGVAAASNPRDAKDTAAPKSSVARTGAPKAKPAQKSSNVQPQKESRHTEKVAGA